MYRMKRNGRRCRAILCRVRSSNPGGTVAATKDPAMQISYESPVKARASIPDFLAIARNSSAPSSVMYQPRPRQLHPLFGNFDIVFSGSMAYQDVFHQLAIGIG